MSSTSPDPNDTTDDTRTFSGSDSSPPMGPIDKVTETTSPERVTESPETDSDFLGPSTKPDYLTAKLQFGVEIEAPLAVAKLDQSGKQAEFLTDWKDARKELARLLKDHGIDAIAGHIRGHVDYSQWNIDIDRSLTEAENLLREYFHFQYPRWELIREWNNHNFIAPQIIPCEIQSAIMHINDPAYKDTFATMWKVIGPFTVNCIEWWKPASTHSTYSFMGPINEDT